MGLACQAKSQCCHTKMSTLAKIFTGKNRIKVRRTASHYAAKRTRENCNVFSFGHHKLKFTTNFDRYAIINVLNCLTKNFESHNYKLVRLKLTEQPNFFSIYNFSIY